MSAFVVSNDHINTLLQFANKEGIRFHARPEHTQVFRMYEACAVDDLDALAEILHAENVRSVNYRYNEQDLPEQFSFTFNRQYPKDAVSIIKMCNCLEYQSCEHPEWETSFAKYVVETIKAYAVNRLPGYNQAPWAFDLVKA